ncbi:hypothetical protein ACFWVC_32270 [Streptomyces sp. NPDC058691]|uniref:Acb2/Tad1 domain-containing protein n=1 Tax=Streptomyces sp. NPDC058691 TaxID=3346601 RepID=UPI00365DE320
MSADEIIHRFTSRPTGTSQHRQAHEDVGSVCLETALTLDQLLPAGAEKQAALFRLEEVMFWADAAVARQPKES